MGLVFPNNPRPTSQSLLSYGLNRCIGFHYFSPAGVNQDGFSAQSLEVSLICHVIGGIFSLQIEWHMQRDDVGVRQHRFKAAESSLPFHAGSGRVVEQHLHAQDAGQPGYFGSDLPYTNHAQCFTSQRPPFR